MKKTIIAVILAASVAGAFAQGTVTFVNVNTAAGLRSPVYGPQSGNSTVSLTGNTSAGLPAGTQVYTGSLLSGSGFSAVLYAANGSGQAEGSLTAATPVSTFRTGGAAGFINQVTATLSGVPLDSAAATLQMRVWDNLGGTVTSWDQAQVLWQAGQLNAGKSALFNLSGIGGNLNTPPFLLPLQSFNIYTVPEPSTIALAGLGVASLLIFRRRKN